MLTLLYVYVDMGWTVTIQYKAAHAHMYSLSTALLTAI